MAALATTLVYVGTYTEKLFFVDGKGEGIYVFALDPATGGLTPAERRHGHPRARRSSRSRRAAATSTPSTSPTTSTERPEGGVSAFAIDPSDRRARVPEPPALARPVPLPSSPSTRPAVS